MPSRYAGQLLWKPRADTRRNADVPPLSRRADRHYSTESVGRPRRRRSGGLAWRTRNDARITWTLAFIQRHAVDDHVSSCFPAAEPVAVRETESLGRHAASPGAIGKTNQRKTTKLFSVESARLISARICLAREARYHFQPAGIAPGFRLAESE